MSRLVVLNPGGLAALSAGAMAGAAVAEHGTPVLLLLSGRPAMLRISPLRKVTFRCVMANPLHELGSRRRQPEKDEEEYRALDHGSVQ